MYIWIVNKINKKDDDIIQWVFDTESKAYHAFKNLFLGREDDNDGDSIAECFYVYSGARLNEYNIMVNVVELNFSPDIKYFP